jgi:hypothetical protein
MLGFRFCPRLRDLPDRKLATIEPATAYMDLAPLIGRRVKVDVVREHWGEVLRLVASLQAGTVLPSAMLKRLAAFQRQNQLDLALQELGRIERTLFMVDWLESPELRQRCQAGLNKSGAAPRARPGDLHLQTGAHRRPRPGCAAVSSVRAQPGDRCHRVLELDLSGGCHSALEKPRQVRAGRDARPHVTAHLGTHRLLRRLPMGPRRRHCGSTPAAQAGTGQDGSMTGVPSSFTLSVVCMTTDALPSNALGHRRNALHAAGWDAAGGMR